MVGPRSLLYDSNSLCIKLASITVMISRPLEIGEYEYEGPGLVHSPGVPNRFFMTRHEVYTFQECLCRRKNEKKNLIFVAVG